MADAYGALTAADEAAGLGAEDLELLARAAYMLGRDDDYVGGLERAHRAHLDAGEALRAVRCAFWIGHNMLFRGETVRARGVVRPRAAVARARAGATASSAATLLIPAWLEQMARGD